MQTMKNYILAAALWGSFADAFFTGNVKSKSFKSKIGSSLFAKKILLCFDGSGDSPEAQCPNEDKDINYSNVLKMHFLAGGRIDGKKGSYEGIPDDQVSLYVRGVGENDNKLNRMTPLLVKKVGGTGINAGFGLLKYQMDIMEKLLAEEIESEDDKLYIFGFSRGAAAARKYSAKLNAEGITKGGLVLKPRVRFLGCWDTVSMQIGNAKQLIGDKYSHKPPSCEPLGEDGKISPNIDEAVHICALDDNRMWKRRTPTLMGKEDRVHEVWFPGEHGDTGGTYYRRGLADGSFEYMQNWITDKLDDDKLAFLNYKDVDPSALKSDKEEGKDGKPEDLEIIPNSADAAHGPHKWKNDDHQRVLYVAENDKVNLDATINIHESVLNHYVNAKADENYTYFINPRLKDVPNFQVVGKNGEVLEGKDKELREKLGM